MGFEIKITKTGKDPLEWIKEIQQGIETDLKERIKLCAELSAEKMREIIGNSGYKLTELANSIQVEVVREDGKQLVIGIGKIENLPKGKDGKTELWELFDAGFKAGASGTYVPLGSFGGEAPNPSKSGGKWVVGSGKWSFFDNNQNKKVVEPLRFVQIGFDELKKEIEIAIQTFLKK